MSMISAAPNGIRAAKVGGNYAAIFYQEMAKSRHFSDVIYLDPQPTPKIEEVGLANSSLNYSWFAFHANLSSDQLLCGSDFAQNWYSIF